MPNSDLLRLYNSYPNRIVPGTNVSPMGVFRQDNQERENNNYYTPGTQNQESELNSSLKITGLDVENSEAGTAQGGEGGPNRTNAYNRLGTVGADGKYTVRGSSPFPLTPTPGGIPLENRDGKQAQFTLNAYTPQETYMQFVATYKDRNKII